ncbi:hypothetical protein MHUMG1_07388 [Metarhizium humberi]|uniref:Uncharacterized protein n=1 Tax=Metarhizium humberi TaxID=2596975 RepID=A0A9P8M786_9HYPO|nr:hypothetical protein MHUMG1_07388 [Metarhizium humberi]
MSDETDRNQLQAWEKELHKLFKEFDAAKCEVKYWEQLKETYMSMCDEENPETQKEMQQYDDGIKKAKESVNTLQREKYYVMDQIIHLRGKLQQNK